MYKINIVCVGSLKEKYFISAQSEYLKRLSRFCEINLVELPEFKLPASPTLSQIEQALDKEYEQILLYLKGKVIILAVEGKMLDSNEFERELFKNFNTCGVITFVIGSSYGISSKLKNNYLISLSKMTFPHHLARIMLEEQIYRAFTIHNNITYHK